MMSKAYHLVASLRGDAVDILQALSEEQRLDFDVSDTLELLFGEKYFKYYIRLQLTATVSAVSPDT